MKVLFLYQDIDSGAKLSTEAIILTLQKLFPEDTYIAYKQIPNRFNGHFSYLKNLCWSIYDYRRVITEKEIDIVYSVMFTAALSLILSKKNRLPFIFHFHGDQKFGLYRYHRNLSTFLNYPYFRLLNRCIIFLQTLAIKTAKHIIFVSEESAKEVFQNYHLQPTYFSYSIIENGVDRNIFKPVSKRNRSILKKKITKSNNFLISYLGRIDEKKGIINLIKAFASFNSERVSLLLAFPKPIDSYSINHLNQIKQEVKDLHLLKKVIYKQSYRKLEHIYQISDVVVLPSIQEMFPLVMLESLASGVLFLSTNVGGVTSVLRKIGNVLLMENNHPQTISYHLKKIMEFDIKEKITLLQKAKLVIEPFTWETASIKIHDIFLNNKITQF